MTGPARTRPPAPRLLVPAVLALAVTIGAAGCGDDVPAASDPAAAVSTASDGAVFDDADVTFATDMVPHHTQAVRMADLTQGRSLDPAVQRLADRIRSEQAPEITTMTGWLSAWGQSTASGSAMSGMPGMLSSQELDQLAAAPDAEFQTRWLQLMMAHHQGAIEMAKTEQADGTNPEALDLAASIITAQQGEIEQIRQLLADGA